MRVSEPIMYQDIAWDSREQAGTRFYLADPQVIEDRQTRWLETKANAT